MKRNIVLITIITVSISTTLLSTLFSYRNAINAADNFLRSQALGIAASLDTTISRYGTKENIFKDIISEGRWEGIAFIALYSRGGLTLLHSNENLINKKIDDIDIRKTIDKGEAVYKYTVLGTNEEVFVLDFPVHHNGDIMVLRIAMHTYPARGIVREARLQLLSIIVVISVLSVGTAFFMILYRKKLELEKILIEKEKLSIIGEMASILAHEIRNPLGSIKGFAQYLKENITQIQKDTEMSDKYLDIIVAESKRIEALTEDLLTYAKQDDLRVERFNLSVLISETLSFIKMPPCVTINSEIPGSLIMTSDRDKIRQVLTNLIQNSIDAISEKGSVVIKAEEVKDCILLSISDSGVGIDEGSMSSIFKPFYTTKTRGTGLGLAIVERYTRAIGGKIKVKSEKSKGSTFYLQIPKNIKA